MHYQVRRPSPVESCSSQHNNGAISIYAYYVTVNELKEPEGKEARMGETQKLIRHGGKLNMNGFAGKSKILTKEPMNPSGLEEERYLKK